MGLCSRLAGRRDHGSRILNLPSVVEHPERLTEQLMKNLSRLHALPLDFDSEDGLKRTLGKMLSMMRFGLLD